LGKDIDLIQAWYLWFAGRPLTDFTLLHLPFLWWGRIGKCLESLGTLTVILDLIGPKRLRLWGKQMGTNPFTGKLFKQAFHSVSMWLLSFAVSFAFYTWIAIRRYRWERHAFNLVDLDRWFPAFIPDRIGWSYIGGLAVLFLIFGITEEFASRGRFRSLLSQAVGWIFVAFFLPAVLVLGVYWALKLGYVVAVGVFAFVSAGITAWLVMKSLDLGFARPVAWVFDRKKPGEPARWTALVLVLVGFHFDLLSS